MSRPNTRFAVTFYVEDLCPSTVEDVLDDAERIRAEIEEAAGWRVLDVEVSGVER